MAVAKPDEVNPDPPGCETIEELFAALESPLLAHALRIVRERGVAEDLVQDAFMRLHTQFEEVRQPRPWLYRTVHNLALNHLRAAGKIVPLQQPGQAGAASDTDTADPRPMPDEEIMRLEGIGLVRLSLETLDDRSREVIRLKFTENFSYKEISLRTGLKEGHVGYLLHHALKNIAIELAKSGIAP